MICKKGLAQVVLMISLLFLAIVLPVLSKVVKQNQDTRRKAAETECGNEGQECCYGLSGSRYCNDESMLCTLMEVDDGLGSDSLIPGDPWPSVVPPDWVGGGLIPGDPWPSVVPPDWVGGGLIPGDPWPSVVPSWEGMEIDPRVSTPRPTSEMGTPGKFEPTPRPTSEMGTPGKFEPNQPPVEVAPIGPGAGGEYYKGVLGVVTKMICTKTGGSVTIIPGFTPTPTPTLSPTPTPNPLCHPIIGCLPDCSCGPKTGPGTDNEPCRLCGILSPTPSPPIGPPCHPIVGCIPECSCGLSTAPGADNTQCARCAITPGPTIIITETPIPTDIITPEPTVIITSTPEPTKKPTDIPGECKACKKIADYNCDGSVNGLDYSWWKQEFVDKLKHDGKWEASYTCSEVVGPEDFSAWRDSYLE